jgi:GT2 family glycosyltransferase
LARCLASIREYCPTEYSIKILSQGEPDDGLVETISKLDDDKIELVVSPVNLGCGGGRRLLVGRVTSPLTMTLDDDMCLTDNSISEALKAYEQDRDIGAVSMPQYDLRGRMISAGGRCISIRDGVILRQSPKLDFQADLIHVNDLDGGAMLFKTEMRECFTWSDQYYGAFDDLDKSMQIIRANKWKQVIVPRGRLIHDRSWLLHLPDYESRRLDGLAMRRSYRIFRTKWGLRLGFRDHILNEIVLPSLTLLRLDWGVSVLYKLIELRTARRQALLDFKKKEE